MCGYVSTCLLCEIDWTKAKNWTQAQVNTVIVSSTDTFVWMSILKTIIFIAQILLFFMH